MTRPNRPWRVPAVWIAALALLLTTSSALAQDPGAMPYTLGAPISHANLTIVPLHHKDAARAPKGQFLTFDEATRAKQIQVTELDGNTSDAEVNAVHVSNLGSKPIFIMSGEIILGGKQDRIIAQNTIIPPNAQQVEVKVFCVEQGRWDGKTAAFSNSGSMGHSELRKKAQFDNNQQEVWKEVAKKNADMKVAPSTGTYRATMDKASTTRDVEPYLAAILPALRRDAQAVGIAVAIDGHFRTIEAFANPMLFAKLRDKLVRSYALEAASSPDGDQPAAKRPPKPAQADAFLKKARKSRREERSSKSGGIKNKFYNADDGSRSVISKDEAGMDVQFMYTK